MQAVAYIPSALKIKDLVSLSSRSFSNITFVHCANSINALVAKLGGMTPFELGVAWQVVIENCVQ